MADRALLAGYPRYAHALYNMKSNLFISRDMCHRTLIDIKLNVPIKQVTIDSLVLNSTSKHISDTSPHLANTMGLSINAFTKTSL